MTHEDTNSDPSFVERLISRMEVFGLNAARLILSAGITLAVFAFVFGLIGLAIMGIDYERRTNPAKYVVSSISFTPHFLNVALNGRPQKDPDSLVQVDRVAAARKDRDQLITERLAVMHEAGVCIGNPDQCHDLDFQRRTLANAFGSNPLTRLPDGTALSLSSPLSAIDLSPYYGEFGFSSAEDAIRAEWEATTACIAAYKQKNGNLYISNTPILFYGIVAQCHYDYRSALQSELARAPADWTLSDSFNAMLLKTSVAICGVSIILIAMTIILFRLEVSFRSLRNLDRLK